MLLACLGDSSWYPLLTDVALLLGVEGVERMLNLPMLTLPVPLQSTKHVPPSHQSWISTEKSNFDANLIRRRRNAGGYGTTGRRILEAEDLSHPNSQRRGCAEGLAE